MVGVNSHPKIFNLIFVNDSAEVILPPMSGIKFLISKSEVTSAIPARVSLISSRYEFKLLTKLLLASSISGLDPANT